jgi:hypothetical protein
MSTSWVLYLRVGFLFSVDIEICRLGLALRIDAPFEFVLFLVGANKPSIL